MKKLVIHPGVTLVELLIVISIIGILASVVIFAINPTKQLGEANAAADTVRTDTIRSALNQYFAENVGYPSVVTTSPQMICSQGYTDPGCISLEGTLTPVYMAGIPQRDTVEEPNSGYFVYISTTGDVAVKTAEQIAGIFRAAEPLRAYSFDGVDDYVVIADDPLLQITENLTISAWIKPATTYNSSLSSYVPIVNKQTSSSTEDSYLFSINGDGKLHFGTSGGNIRSTTASFPADTWVHLVGTFRNNGGSPVGELYVNGVQETLSVDTFDTMAATANAVWIGESNVASYVEFEGEMFDVRIYDKSLTTSEVTYVYTFGASGTDPSTANLVAQYKMDDNHTKIAYDSSGNENHGTKTSTTASTFHYEGTDVPYSWQNTVGFSPRMIFDQSDDYISVAHDASLNFTNDFRLAAKIVPNTIGNYGIIGKRKAYNNNAEYGLVISGGGDIVFGWTNNGTTNETVTGPPAVVGELYDIVVTYDSTTVTLTVNGTDYTQAETGSMFTGSYPVYIGAINDPAAAFFDGLIWDVEIGSQATVVASYSGNNTEGWQDLTNTNTGTVNGTPRNAFVPRDESNTAYDILGSLLEYVGPSSL